VQEVDRHVPAVADLWSRHFNFLPTWRRDDVMVSYARKDGGIGAHVDNYDVSTAKLSQPKF
jgi:50S ribosomal protein L16 3-hydroxylase